MESFGGFEVGTPLGAFLPQMEAIPDVLLGFDLCLQLCHYCCTISFYSFCSTITFNLEFACLKHFCIFVWLLCLNTVVGSPSSRLI